MAITIEMMRKRLNDYTSTDEQLKEMAQRFHALAFMLIDAAKDDLKGIKVKRKNIKGVSA